MAAGIWFWIWLALIIASSAVIGLLLKSVFNRLLDAAHQAQRLADKLELLSSKLEQKPTLEPVENSVLEEPGLVRQRRQRLLKARIKKQEQRQRRLIASLKSFDPNESRFRK